MSPDGTTLGASGGAQSQTLTEGQMPSHTHVVSGSTSEAGSHTHSVNESVGGDFVQSGGSTLTPYPQAGETGMAGAHSHTISVSAANTGGGQAHPNVQPTILLNKIIKATN